MSVIVPDFDWYNSSFGVGIAKEDLTVNLLK